jgi:hypothetical protein
MNYIQCSKIDAIHVAKTEKCEIFFVKSGVTHNESIFAVYGLARETKATESIGECYAVSCKVYDVFMTSSQCDIGNFAKRYAQLQLVVFS